MAFAETANLAVKLTLGGNFTSQLAKTRAGLQGFDRDASRAFKAGGQIGTGIKRGAAIAAAGIGVLVAQVGFGLDSLIQLESATAQTEAVIKSTGGVAAQTAVDVRRLAESFESLNATVDDKVIQSAENLLLTFTNVRGKAFEPTLAAALDMNQALGGGPDGLQGVMMKLGKAMNSPAEGFTALKRAGVLFNKEQQAILKGSDSLNKEELKHYLLLKKRSKAEAEAYKAGVLRVKLEAAQALILKELSTEFGGSFKRAGDTTAGSIAKMGDAIEDLQKALATALLPTIRNLADALSALFQDPTTMRSAEALGKSIGKLFSKDNIAKGIGAIKSAMEVIRNVAGPIADVIGKAVGAFTSLPPLVQQLLVGGFVANKLTGGLITNIAGGLFGALKAMTVQAGVVNVSGRVVTGGGGGGGGGGVGKKNIGSNLLGAVQKVFLVGAVIGVFAELKNAIDDQAKEDRQQAVDLTTKTNAYAQTASVAAMQSALKGITEYDRKLSSNGDPTNLEAVKFQLNINGVRDAVRAQAATLRSAISQQTDLERGVGAGTITGLGQVAAAAQRDADASSRAAAGSYAAAAGSQAAAAAIKDRDASVPRVTVNVKTVVTAAHVSQSSTIQNRWGPSGGAFGGGGKVQIK